MLRKDLLLEVGRPTLQPINFTPSSAPNPISRTIQDKDVTLEADNTAYTTPPDMEIPALSVTVEDSPADNLDSDVFNGKNQYDDLILKYSEKEGVDPLLVKCMIKQESSFNPNAQSSVGACGLMQLTKSTGDWLGVKDLYDPEQNIAAGTKYFAQLLKQFNNDVTLALAAYNAGPGNVQKFGNTVPPYKETLNHIEQITNTYTEATGGKFCLPQMHNWTQQEKDNVEAGIKETYGEGYNYDITYKPDGTYEFDIINASGKKMDPQEVLKGYDKPMQETKVDLRQDIPDDAKVLPQKAADDAKLQAGLNWTYDKFSDDDGNFNGQGFANWVNHNYGEGNAYHYTGDDAQNAFGALQDAASSGDWGNFWNNVGNYSSGSSSTAGAGYNIGGFDVFSVGGGSSSGSTTFDAFCNAMREGFMNAGGGSNDRLSDRRTHARMMQTCDREA